MNTPFFVADLEDWKDSRELVNSPPWGFPCAIPTTAIAANTAIVRSGGQEGVRKEVGTGTEVTEADANSAAAPSGNEGHCDGPREEAEGSGAAPAAAWPQQWTMISQW